MGLYDGLGLDGRPEQGKSPVPFLTLRELIERIEFAEWETRNKGKSLFRLLASKDLTECSGTPPGVSG